jgi:hypothetical protein
MTALDAGCLVKARTGHPCSTCRDEPRRMRREYFTASARKAAARGLCRHCKGTPALPGKVLCARCRRKNVLRMRKRAASKNSPGRLRRRCTKCDRPGHNSRGHDVEDEASS